MYAATTASVTTVEMKLKVGHRSPLPESVLRIENDQLTCKMNVQVKLLSIHATY